MPCGFSCHLMCADIRAAVTTMCAAGPVWLIGCLLSQWLRFWPQCAHLGGRSINQQVGPTLVGAAARA